MSQAAPPPSAEDSIGSEREREVFEAVEWLIEHYGHKKTEDQLLYALAICRRLRAEDGGSNE